MKRMQFLVIILISAFICMAPYAASAIGFEAAVGGWKQDPSGDISYKGQALDIDNELKYNSKTKVFGRVKIDMPLILPNIYLMATPMKFEADGIKTANFTFGDTTFRGNVPFSSKLQLNHYDIALYYGLPFINTATAKKLNIDIGLNARIIDFEAEISGLNLAGDHVTATKSLTLPMPMIYAGVQVRPLQFLSIEAEARGIAYSSSHYYDLIGRLKVKPFGPVFLAGGYRLEDIKIDESNVKANIKFKGPFVEAGFEF